jgi:hypothetical protein
LSEPGGVATGIVAVLEMEFVAVGMQSFRRC